jgi:hypothetical protein
MSDKPEAPERLSLSRWSRRKLEAGADAAVPANAAPQPAAPAPTVAPELPSVESLKFDSDFAAFLRPEVDEKLKRAALKQLFRDPRFNVMDGLDTYIDDYTKADPIPPDMLKSLMQRFAAVAGTGKKEEERAPEGHDAPPPAAATPLPVAAGTAALEQSKPAPAGESAPVAPRAPSSKS